MRLKEYKMWRVKLMKKKVTKQRIKNQKTKIRWAQAEWRVKRGEYTDTIGKSGNVGRLVCPFHAIGILALIVEN